MNTIKLTAMVQFNILTCFVTLSIAFITLASGQEENDRPRSDQKSLMIVFDTTGSMSRDLEQLRLGANDIVNNFASREDNPIFNYILSLFNDPCKLIVHNLRKLSIKTLSV